MVAPDDSMSNVSSCSLKTVLQVAEYGTVRCYLSLLFASICIISLGLRASKNILNRYDQHAVGKDSAARGSQGLVHTVLPRLEHHTLTSASCRWHVHF